MRHNKKCAQYAACRELWLRAANEYYQRTGDDGQAVIRANVAAKKWLQSHGKYRRNMDEDLRALEREAQKGDEYAAERLRRARERAGLQLPPAPEGGWWINAYINNQPVASLSAFTQDEVDSCYQFLESYFKQPPVAPQAAHEVFDVSLQDYVLVPQESFGIQREESPAFDFSEGTSIPRPYHREPYNVHLFIVDSLYIGSEQEQDLELEEDGADVMEQEEYDEFTAPRRWVNVYEVTRHYGGPQEGGWWYNYDWPVGCVYINYLSVEDSRNINYPPHVAMAHQFLSDYYREREWGNIYHSTGGLEIHIRNEPAPPRSSDIPHYE